MGGKQKQLEGESVLHWYLAFTALHPNINNDLIIRNKRKVQINSTWQKFHLLSLLIVNYPLILSYSFCSSHHLIKLSWLAHALLQDRPLLLQLILIEDALLVLCLPQKGITLPKGEEEQERHPHLSRKWLDQDKAQYPPKYSLELEVLIPART